MNNFLKQYLEIPKANEIRYFVFGAVLLVNIFDPMMIYLFETLVLRNTLWNNKMYIYIAVIIIFDIWSLCMVIFPNKLSKYFNLYIATAFTGTSIYFLYVSDVIIFFELGLFYVIITILIYLLMILTAIVNIASKMHKKEKYIINTRNTASIAFIGAAAGVLLPKPAISNQSNLPLAGVLLVISYSLSFGISGFHKFYLRNKMDKIQNK